jgi:hypothetical protein
MLARHSFDRLRPQWKPSWPLSAVITGTSRTRYCSFDGVVSSGALLNRRNLSSQMTYFKLITHKDWVRYQDIEKSERQEARV